MKEGQTQEPVGGIKNVPQKIYLQVDSDGETPEDFNELMYIEVSWCSVRIHPNDIEYSLTQPPAPTIDDYKESFEDHKRLVRELDVIINGKNAAKQASLCDIVAQLSKEYKSHTLDINKFAEENIVKEFKGSLEQYAVDNFKAGYAASQNIVGPMLSIPPDVLRKALAKGTGHSSVEQNEFLNFCIENKITLK